MDTLNQLQKLADGLELTDDPDELGRIDRVIRRLNEVKRLSLAELPGPVEGEDYKVEEARSAKRSYNTAGLLKAFGDRDYNLHDLLAEDAVRLSWRWTELRRAATKANVTLAIAGHEIEDQGEIDGPLVGEVWETRYNIKGTQ